MKKIFLEETVLFISIIKWAILATLTGIVVGLSSTLFLKSLGWSTDWNANFISIIFCCSRWLYF